MFPRCLPLRGSEDRLVKFLLISLSVLLLFSTTLQAQTVAVQVREIDSLVKKIDTQAKRAKAARLVFADVSDPQSDSPAKWQRFDTEKALDRHRDKTEAYTIAYVWRDRGKVVSTNFTLSSPSGDWVKYVYSYFRPDGSLARVETDYRTFNGDFIVVRRRYFDSAGKQIKSSVTFRDLATRQPKKAPAEGVMGDDPNEVSYYMTSAKLPFAHLLTRK